MLQVVPRWRVDVVRVDSAKNLVFWIAAPTISEVFRQLASMQFCPFPEEPVQVIVGPAEK